MSSVVQAKDLGNGSRQERVSNVDLHVALGRTCSISRRLLEVRLAARGQNGAWPRLYSLDHYLVSPTTCRQVETTLTCTEKPATTVPAFSDHLALTIMHGQLHGHDGPFVLRWFPRPWFAVYWGGQQVSSTILTAKRGHGTIFESTCIYCVRLSDHLGNATSDRKILHSLVHSPGLLITTVLRHLPIGLGIQCTFTFNFCDGKRKDETFSQKKLSSSARSALFFGEKVRYHIETCAD